MQQKYSFPLRNCVHRRAEKMYFLLRNAAGSDCFTHKQLEILLEERMDSASHSWPTCRFCVSQRLPLLFRGYTVKWQGTSQLITLNTIKS